MPLPAVTLTEKALFRPVERFFDFGFLLANLSPAYFRQSRN